VFLFLFFPSLNNTIFWLRTQTLSPAKNPVHHADCRLNPPVNPSMSKTSPAKYKFGQIFDSIVLGFTSEVFTPPAVTNSSPEILFIIVSRVFFRSSMILLRSFLLISAFFFWDEICAILRIFSDSEWGTNFERVFEIVFVVDSKRED